MARVATVRGQVWMVTLRNDVTALGFPLGLPLPSPSSAVAGPGPEHPAGLSRREEAEAAGGEGRLQRHVIVLRDRA